MWRKSTLLFILLTMFGRLPLALAADLPPVRMIMVGHRHVAFYVKEGHLPVIVLDAWGGGDASHWKDLIPTLAEATGSKIIAYDRAGFGLSDEVRLPFNLSSAVDDLTSGLIQLGATKDLILVPHSFAGEVAFGLAQIHRSWLYGAVFVDANLPNFYNADQTRRQYTESKPLGDKLVQKENSKRTRSIKAMLDAQLTTNTMFHRESCAIM